jgi:hypothetical protein
MNELSMSQEDKINALKSLLDSGGSETFDSHTFILSIVFGIIGMFYFSVGRKNNNKEMFLYTGIALMVFPYFVNEQTATFLAGLGLTLLPFVVKKFLG